MAQISRKSTKNSAVSVIHLITNTRLLITASLCLTGCMGVYEGGFECPPGEGVGCKSISEVNDMVNRDQITALRSQELKAETEEHRDKDFENPKAPNSCFLNSAPCIWYAPSSGQYSATRTQKNYLQSLKLHNANTEKTGVKGDVQNSI